jgi:hypothetical protein
MRAHPTFQKALLLLDQGHTGRGEDMLRCALELARVEGADVTFARVLCCLGELLHAQARDAEAVPMLQQVASYDERDDLLASEVKLARKVLQEIEGR